MSKKNYENQPQSGIQTDLPEFRHNISIGENGERLYDMPIPILSKADLHNYGIGWDDCRTLSFHGSESIRVYYFKTPNRELAEFQWRELDSQHSRGYAQARCMVPGKQKAFVRCRDTNSCAACPYGIKPEDRQAPVISWNQLAESGFEPGSTPSPEDQVHHKLDYEAIRALWDAEDKRISKAFEMKELFGYTVEEIAAELDVSCPRVYQLLSQARKIGKKYKQDNE